MSSFIKKISKLYNWAKPVLIEILVIGIIVAIFFIFGVIYKLG